MLAAMAKVNEFIRILNGLPNLDTLISLYKYYTINFFKSQTCGGRRHMEKRGWLISGDWRNENRFQTSTKNLHMRVREGGFGASPTVTRRQLYHIIMLLSRCKNAQKRAVFIRKLPKTAKLSENCAETATF